MDQPIAHNSLAEIISTLQKILATTNLDADRRNLRIIPRDIPSLAQLQSKAARLTGSGPISGGSSNAGSGLLSPISDSTSDSKPDSNSNSDSISTSDSTNSDALSRLATHLAHDVLPYLNLASLSPNYYGFVIGGVTPAALLGDFVASIYDQNAHLHLPHETVSTALEVAALNKLVQLFRLPEADWAIGGSGPGGGIFTTGATASNVLGLALGREYVLRKALENRKKLKNQNSTADDEDATGPSSDRFSCGEYGMAELMVEAGVRRIQVLSTLSHSSIAKAASVVGIGRKNVVSVLATATTTTTTGSSSNVSVNANPNPLQIDLDRLETEARRSHSQDGDGVLSILTISAGEVNTGRFATDSYQTMSRIRQICDQYGVWIHVDGAFGLFGRLFDPAEEEEENDKKGRGGEDQYREVTRGVAGLELADSITADGHKLLNVPYDCGLFFTRHKELSEQVFGNPSAAYLKPKTQRTTKTGHGGDSGGGGSGGSGSGSGAGNDINLDLDHIQSPLNIGLENSRRFRALPVYCTLTAYGREGYLDMLKRQITLARRVTKWLLQDERFQVLPTTTDSDDEILAKTFMVVLFRVRDEAKSPGFVDKVNATGKIYLSSTVWDGRPAARIAISNWQVDVERDAKIIQDVLHRVLEDQES